MRCIAVDDEQLAINKIIRFVEKIDYLELVQTFDNAIDVLNYLKSNEIDLIFLDIEMEELTGIEFLESLQNPPLVIITSAYKSYSIKGYELNVTDYLLKPILFPRFLKAIEKAHLQFTKEQQIKSISKTNKNNEIEKTIFVKAGTKLMQVPIKEIIYIEGLKDYLIIHTKKSNKIITNMSFADILNLLPENYFARTHKSFIISLIHLKYVDRMQIGIEDKVLPIGRHFKDEFMEILKKYQKNKF